MTSALRQAIRGHLPALLIVLIMTSAGCQKAGQTGQPSITLHISTLSNGIDYAPYFVARDRGWFEEALKADGVRVEHVPPFEDLPPVNDALDAKSIDLLFEAEIPAIVGRASGKDLQVVGMLSAVRAEELVVPMS